MSKKDWLNFNLTCNVCGRPNIQDRLYLATRPFSILICIDCECGANNILKIIDKKELERGVKND